MNRWVFVVGGISLFVLTVFFLPALVWVALVPILVANGNENKIQGVIKNSVVFGMMTALLVGWWAIKYSFNVFVLHTGAFTLFIVLFLILSWKSMKMVRHPLNIVFPPMIWVILQWVFSFFLVDSYWATLAIFQPMTAPLIWVVGGSGITFLIVLSNSAFSNWFQKKDTISGVVFACIVVVIGASYLFSSITPMEGEEMVVSLIQGNIQQNYEWRVEHAGDEILATYVRLTREAMLSHPEVIVWPEYAIAEDIDMHTDIAGRLALLSVETNATIILGSLKWLDGKTEGERNKHDVAIAVSPDSTVQHYASVLPLPYEAWTVPGSEIGIFSVGNKQAGITLCYEETQMEINKQHSMLGADFLVSMANDLIFTDSDLALELSSRYSRLRSAENKKYMLRATNTGITQVISPRGKVLGTLEPNTEGILTYTIYM